METTDKQEEEQHVVVRLFAIRYFRILYIFIQMFSFFLNILTDDKRNHASKRRQYEK